MNLNQLKIGHRLALGFGLVIALMCIIVGLAAQRLQSVQTYSAVAVDMQSRATLANEWRGLVQLNVSRALAIAKAGGTGETASFFTPLMKQTSERISELQQQITALVDTDKGKTVLADIAQQRASYTEARKSVLDMQAAGESAAAQAQLASQMLPKSDAYIASLDALAVFQRERSAQAAEQVRAQARVAIVQSLLLLALAVALAAGFGWALTRSILRPLRDTQETTRHIAASDLSQTIVVEGRDEMAEMQMSLSKMQLSLRTIISEMRAGSDAIGTASAQIASGNQDLSTRTEQTSSSLQQAASSLEELTGTVSQTADSARTANQLAASASQAAQRGGDVVGQVVITMQDINSSSSRIADIIGTIDGIAFQTNILALNAAVEAARAGEQGRGFAVVASEVRSLAQRSAQAAREIKSLIQASVEKVETGTRLVQDAGSAMGDIVNGVQRVTDVIGEISAATAEQAVGLRQVNEAVAGLDQMTQQNAALVEESAAAAASMADQSRKLGTVVASFVLAEGASAAPGGAAARPRAVPVQTAPSPAPQAKAVAQQVLADARKAKPVEQNKAQPQQPPAKPTGASQRKAVAASTATADDQWESF